MPKSTLAPQSLTSTWRNYPLMFDTFVLLAAAFFAGGVNAIAGGGSFLTFPALLFAGVPIISANATSTLVVFPGYLSSTFGFLQELREFNRRQLIVMLILAAAGGVLGALLLLTTPSQVFSKIVPWLLLLATLLFAIGDKVADFVQQFRRDNANRGWWATLLVAIYGGYFNGGLGIVLLALFAALGFRDIKLMSGLKNCLSAILSLFSVVIFSLAGLIYWHEAVLMMVAATLGGYGGAVLVKLLPARIVRIFVVVSGSVMTLGFFLRVH